MSLKYLVGIVLLAACSSPTDLSPKDGRVLGAIEHYGDGLRLEVPDTVAAGEPFSVTVYTYGAGCHAQGDTQIAQRTRSATIRPYDYAPRGSTICIDILRLFAHQAVLEFTHTGAASVTIVGRRHPENELITITRSIVVR